MVQIFARSQAYRDNWDEVFGEKDQDKYVDKHGRFWRLIKRPSWRYWQGPGFTVEFDPETIYSWKRDHPDMGKINQKHGYKSAKDAMDNAGMNHEP